MNYGKMSISTAMPAQLFTLSANTEQELRSQVARIKCELHINRCEGGQSRLERIVRSHDTNEFRLGVVYESIEHLISLLDSFEERIARDSVSFGRGLLPRRPKVAFMFSGHGGHWWAMGVQLFNAFDVYRDAINLCDQRIRALANWSLIELMHKPGGEDLLDDTFFAQPAIFALQVALVKLWESWGVYPDALVGRSVGEVAASHIAGCMTLDQAVELLVSRARAMQAAPGGAMLSVALSPDELRSYTAVRQGYISIAAVNGPRACIASGYLSQIESLRMALMIENIESNMLPIKYAFHSSCMSACRESFRSAIVDFSGSMPSVPIVSTVTGNWVGREMGAAEYWASNMTQPVLFAPSVKVLADSGITAFVEIGPHLPFSQGISEVAGPDAISIASMDRKKPEVVTILRSLSRLYVHGYATNADPLDCTVD